MNNIERIRGWKSLKERLTFKGLGCCGATWRSPTRGAPTMTILQSSSSFSSSSEEDEEEEEEQPIIHGHGSHMGQFQVPNSSASSGMMNLATALAAERNLRGSNVGPDRNRGQQIKTLMRLIEETDGVDLMKNGKWRETNEGERGNGSDWVCCVCMERNKGAAFIPCGHAFCRVCSRELWVHRESCPICNRSILQILDIF